MGHILMVRIWNYQGYLDRESPLVFSPNGEHLAYVDGKSKIRYLSIDEKKGKNIQKLESIFLALTAIE